MTDAARKSMFNLDSPRVPITVHLPGELVTELEA